MMPVTLGNFDHCCRCCLSTIPPFHPLFGLSLNDLLADITSLEMTVNDGYPQQVCRRCCSKIASSSAFRNLVLKNQQILKELLQESVSVEEIDLKPGLGEVQSNFININSNVLGDCVDVEQNSIANESGKDITVIKHDNNDKNNYCLVEDKLKSISNVKDTGNASVTICTSVNNSLHTLTEDDAPEISEDDRDDYSGASSEECHKYMMTTLKCQFCKLECKNRLDMKVHLKNHDETCNVCNKTISRWNRNRHMRTHAVKHICCKECGKEFSDRSYFREHLKKHRNEMPAARKDCLCSYCGRKYRWKSSLYRHLHIHVGNSHDCELCGRKFTNPYYLKIHLVQHMGPENKPFKCEQCSSKFTRETTLVQHRRNVHSGPRQRWSCSYCDKKFLHKVTQARHEALQHWTEPKIFKCAECGKKFKSRRSLGLHLRVHKTSQKPVEGDSLQDSGSVQVKSEGIEKITVVRVEEYAVNSAALHLPMNTGL